ncbi:MAG: bifunctional hydroxymethylpyrimidine kinase/phosphomethylpyrimidine kinase [Spirochaetes bacterium]|nr:bifunctional hydroxymethylpyrimidine kinase/phosphomethylpyrimidine kinase [Spirochaetota bacterium]
MCNILVISGLDPSGCAGFIKDIQICSLMGITPLSTISTFTIQTFDKAFGFKFRRKEDIIDEIIKFKDNIKFIKIGLCEPDLLKYIRDIFKEAFILWNPVIYSSTGLKFLDEKEIKKNINFCDLVILNREEAKLCKLIDQNHSFINFDFKDKIVITSSDEKVEVIYKDYKLVKEKVYIKSKVDDFRGTGCSFSMLVLIFLSMKYNIYDAIDTAVSLMNKILKHSNVFITSPVNLLKDWYRYSIIEEMKEIQNYIIDSGIYTIPEVGKNYSYSLPFASNENDICKFPGRIRLVNDKVKIYEEPSFYGTSHTGRMILEIKRYFPSINCCTNTKYDKKYIENAINSGLKVYFVDREKEPEEIREQEGMSLKWIIDLVCKELKEAPDIIYDNGCIGKEPMIRIFGKNLEEVINKERRIIKFN